MTDRHTVDTITSDALDELYTERDRATEIIARLAVVVAHAYELTPAEILEDVRTVMAERETAPAAAEATGPIIDRPFRSHRTELLAGVRDLSIPDQQTTGLVVQQYRADDGNQKWVFRCWGTDTCDGWLSLDHTSQQSAERARDRHVTEEHTETPTPAHACTYGERCPNCRD